MNDEELMANRLCELATRSYTDNYYTYTDFLGLADISLLQKLVKYDDRMRGIPYRMSGGTDNAERVVAAFGDEDAFGYAPEFPIKCIRARPRSPKFADRLTHRDFLGAVLNLGIGREQIGDIYINDNRGYIFCLEGMADYIVQNLERIKHTAITCEYADELPDTMKEVKDSIIQVPSERVDAVTAKVYKLSRNAARTLITQRKVFINGNQCENTSTVLKSGDIVSARGYGRYVYKEVTKTTGKGNLMIHVQIW